MHQRTAKKAIPKQAQLRRSAEAQETMGNLSKKKQRPPKHFFHASRSSAPAYWEKLILNWNNYSIAQKIAVITAGLVLSGVAVYLAVGLAQSVYANMSAELDTPHKTREPSVFTRIDRALSFPVAHARPLPQKSKMHESYPEFTEGTDEHDADIKKEMAKGFRAIDDALYDFLQTPSEKSKVVALFEAHTQSSIFKNLIMAYLTVFSRETHTRITIIHELSASETNDQQLTMLHQNMRTFRKSSAVYPTSLIENLLERNCYKHNIPNIAHRITGLAVCAIQAAGLYDFNIAFANSGESTSLAFQIYDVRFDHLFNGHQVDLEKIDNKLTSILKRQLSYSTPDDIVVIVSGELHGRAVSLTLNNSKHPHRLLNLREKEAYALRDAEVKMSMAGQCLKPLSECPPRVQNLKQTYPIRFCMDGKYIAGKKCDETSHRYYSDIDEREAFARGKAVIQIPPTLPDRYPQKLTDFFAPKSSMKMLKAKLEQDTKKSEKKNNSRMEL
ncbi:MAG: hypothetical protein SFW07_06040 [Gammaproteobacteria bacterium]|nr:hypothetical protein [Gammaproteobacteria bacterium]